MMRLAPARRRAGEFAEAVDGGPASDAALAEHRAFLALVQQLRDLDQPVPRSEFADDLRARLMAAAPDALAADPTGPAKLSRRESAVVSFPVVGRGGRRAASIAAAVCIVAGSGVGVAAASQSALPGQALYPVKRGIEHVEVAVAGSQHDKGRELLDQADTRISEVTDLAVARADDPSTPTLMRETLDDFTEQAKDGADALISAYRDDGSRASISELRTFTDQSARRLDALAATVPPAADQALSDAASALSELDRQAHDLCPSCSALPTLQLSSALIALQHEVDTVTDAAPGVLSPNSVDAPRGDANRPAQGGGPHHASPQGDQDGPVSQPTLPDITSALDPSATSPGGDSSQPSSAGLPTLGGGATVKVDGGPSVPIPTIDLNDPLGVVPQIIDDVTNSVDQLPVAPVVSGIDLP
jgi:hypothetical protein